MIDELNSGVPIDRDDEIADVFDEFPPLALRLGPCIQVGHPCESDGKEFCYVFEVVAIVLAECPGLSAVD